MKETKPMHQTGRCHCGRVRYEAELTSGDRAYYCHCEMCRKSFGNIFATFVHTAKKLVHWTAAEPKYFTSSKLARRGFCPDCGTPLTFEYLDSEWMDLSVGSLDRPDLVRPTEHEGVEGRLASFHKPDDLPEQRTEDRHDFLVKWENAYGPGAKPGLQTRG